jgi:NADP-dependent 3-hydroxy acid dehydrogenase YdfG
MSQRVALITGAGSGVGAAITRRLAADGFQALLIGRRMDALTATAAGLPEARCFAADLADDAELARVCATITAEIGRLDALVHNAAEFRRGALADTPADDFEAQWRVNTRAPYALTRALLPLLRSARGDVLFVNSSVAHAAQADLSGYSASKAALKSLADSLRAEVNADGVRVCSLYLGRVATPLQARLAKDLGRAYHPELLLQPEDIAASVAHVLALPQTAEITDLHVRPRFKS